MAFCGSCSQVGSPVRIYCAPWEQYSLRTIIGFETEKQKKAQWSLFLFGVVPEHHRKGIATAMMHVVEERARADGVSTVLEITTDLDLLNYQRMGFEVKGQVTVTCPFGQLSCLSVDENFVNHPGCSVLPLFSLLMLYKDSLCV